MLGAGGGRATTLKKRGPTEYPTQQREERHPQDSERLERRGHPPKVLVRCGGAPCEARNLKGREAPDRSSAHGRATKPRCETPRAHTSPRGGRVGSRNFAQGAEGQARGKAEGGETAPTRAGHITDAAIPRARPTGRPGERPTRRRRRRDDDDDDARAHHRCCNTPPSTRANPTPKIQLRRLSYTFKGGV